MSPYVGERRDGGGNVGGYQQSVGTEKGDSDPGTFVVARAVIQAIPDLQGEGDGALR